MQHLAQLMRKHLTRTQVTKLEKVLWVCRDWNYEFNKDSAAATVFAFQQIFFFKNFMNDMSNWQQRRSKKINDMKKVQEDKYHEQIEKSRKGMNGKSRQILEKREASMKRLDKIKEQIHRFEYGGAGEPKSARVPDS